MNDLSVRTEIIRYHLSKTRKTKDYAWLGTWVVREQNKQLVFEEIDPVVSTKKSTRLVSVQDQPDPTKRLNRADRTLSVHDLVRQKASSFSRGPRYVMFTVCILYDIHLVHYVSFMYDAQKKELTSFDPGVELYHHGQKTIVPLVQQAFEKAHLIAPSHHKIFGACHRFGFKNKKMGVQFNGNIKGRLPADAFCQSWTIFFFVRLLHSSEKDPKTFLYHWCNIHPYDREPFITSFFILPVLTYFPKVSKKYEDMVQQRDAIQLLFAPIEECFFHNGTRKHST